jgi:hypothetical protein
MQKWKCLFFLLCFPLILNAQTYSRWNYDKTSGNNTEADNKIISDVTTAMENHATGVVRIYIRYSYPETDSSITIYGLENHSAVVYKFDPIFPDSAIELERKNEVIVLTRPAEKSIPTIFRKDSPPRVKKQVMFGKDEMVKEEFRIKKVSKFVVDKQVKEEVKKLDKAVKLALADNKVWYTKTNKKLSDSEKRKAALRVATKKDKDSDYIKKYK